MARVAKPLTDTQIKNAKPRDKEYNLADGQGLALRVKTNGTKQWLFNYEKPIVKSRTNISLGTYPDLTLADARSISGDYRALLAKDIDPKSHREQSEQGKRLVQAQTFEVVATGWFEIKKTRVTADYAEDVWRSFKLHLFPKIGQVPIAQLKPSQTIDVIRPIAAKGNLETVKRLCQRINEVMVYALNTGVIETNTHSGITEAFNKPVKKSMPSIPPDELPQLMRTINQASIKRITRCLIEWQLHTMVRPKEAAYTRWEEIDFAGAYWNIPDTTMKKRRTHVVPLSPQALAILEVMKPISGHREYVFTSQVEYDKPANPQTANMALKRMGYAGRLVAHGLRSIASTAMNEQRFDAEVIEVALSHLDKNQVRAAYNRALYIDQRRELMNWWSNYIEQAAQGNLGVAAVGKVVLGDFGRKVG